MEEGFNLIEAAQLLGIKVRTARQWVHDGKLMATKLAGSRRWVVLESEIRRVRGESNDGNED